MSTHHLAILEIRRGRNSGGSAAGYDSVFRDRIRGGRMLRIERFKEAKYLAKIVGAEDREGAVADEQIRADRGHTVDVSRDGVDGYAVVECDPRGDQGTALETGLDDEKYV
jgi:hypothetical protein